ncbi:MAG: ABC transporter permease subunit [Burkholderiales bacterium]
MSAFRTTVKHEWRRLRRDRALPWLLLVFAAICGYAAWQGKAWKDERQLAVTTVATQVNSTREQFLQSMREATARDPDFPAATFMALAIQHFPTLAADDFAALAIGQADGYPYEARLHAVASPITLFGALGPAIANPAGTAVGYLDLAFVIVALLPLFLLIATFDLWTQERDLGTSGLILSQPVRPGAILAAKALVRGGGALLGLLLVCLVALLCVAGYAPSMSLAYAALGALIAAYGTFWIAVALAINLAFRRATEAALACGAAWLGLVILLPAVLYAASNLGGAPSAASHINALRALEMELRDQPRERRDATDPRDAILKQRVEDLRRTLRNAQSEHRAYNRIIDGHQTHQAAQRRLTHALRFLSPAVVTEDALERLAGTDADRASEFGIQVRQFLKDVQQHAATRTDSEETLSVDALYAKLPHFAFRRVARAGALLADLGALLLFTSLPLLLALRYLRRNRLLSHELGDVR